VPLVPSITKLHAEFDTWMWMPVIVPFVTPVVETYLSAFSDHATVPDEMETVWPAAEQLLKLIDVTVPRPLPGSPVPDFSVPVELADVQVALTPDVVSLITVVPAVPVMAPPGWTDHVPDVVARAGVAVRPAARAQDSINTAALTGLRIVPRSFP
jgi:hypothetical protein